jgi:hypothetical protein
MLRSHPVLFLGATLICLGACTATTFTSTWKAPNGQTINPFRQNHRCGVCLGR